MVRRSWAPTRRAIYSAVEEEDWIESPRTGAALRRASEPSVDDIRARAKELAERGYPGDAPELQRRAKAELSRTLTVMRRLQEGMGRFPPHVHLDFAERFEVVKGAAEAEIDRDKLRLTTANGRSTLYVPPGVPHVNPYNDENDVLEYRQSFEPGTEGARSYVETLAAMLADGRDDNGELPWSLIAAVADVTRERTYLTPIVWGAPRGDGWSYALQRKVALPIGAAVAKLRHYHVHLEPSHGLRPSRSASR
jgi:mannose-6-phosphate isomerase-like protein (cupin superfamily)